MSQQQKYSIDSSAVVSALASGLISYCKTPNAAYLKCKADSQDPEKCLKEAIECRKCAFKLANEYLDEKNGCSALFTEYVTCLRDNQFLWKKCYPQRVMFEACASDKIVCYCCCCCIKCCVF
jgi:hypothetical protein